MFKKTVIALTCLLLVGCVSTTLDRAITQCVSEGGKPSYTRSESVEKFQCAS